MKIDVKPLSVNEAWQGRRVKTEKYRNYETVCLLLLKKMDIPKGPLTVRFVFGVSNVTADTDNPVKPFLDILQKKYGFNDSRVYRIDSRKIVVKKGEEFVQFQINRYEGETHDTS